MYALVTTILSIFPEKIYDLAIGFLSQLKYGNYLERIKKELCNSDKEEYKKLGNSIVVKNFFYPYSDNIGSKYEDYPVEIVKTEGYNAVKYGGVDIYLPKKWTKTKCKSYFKSLLIEQDERSSHLYLTERIKDIDNYGTIIDLGAAEGIFTADVINKSEKCYLFECDDNYIDCLEKTFSPFGKKVSIVKKYVSDRDNDNEITLDSFFGENIPEDIGLIKMDIEGAEQAALRGMQKVLEKNPNAILLICVYHSQDAEKEIRNILDGYDFRIREGYRLVLSMGEQRFPYFRHGVMEATKNRIQ